MTRITKPNRSLRGVFALACLTVAFVLPGQASAQTTVINGQKCTPTEAQYRAPSSPALNCEPIATGGNSFGPLPFTGLDLISLLAIAVALTGAGLALRRLTPNEEKGK